VAAGEVHALLGENGAGKSTLMNVLIGLVRPDRGELILSGDAIAWRSWSPAEAARRGVGMVHQHSSLVPAMNAVENLCFGGVDGPWRFSPRAERARVAALAERFGLAVPLDRPVDELSPGELQRAEILRALARGAKLLVLDEPTAVLTPGESEHLFASMRRMRDEGRALIFISHKLDEVEAIADRVTVLRRGVSVATRDAAATDARELGRLMLGADLPPLERSAECSPGAVRLEIRDLSAPGLSEAGRLRGLALAVRGGEVVGVAGIDGNGQRELEEVLAGVRAPASGSVAVDGRVVSPNVRALRAAGVAHLSGDRERAGLVPGFSLTENLILKGSYDDARFFPRGALDLAAARAATREVAERFGIRPPDPDLDIASFSGGNAQKLAVARELEDNPAALVAVNPTRGLDVGSARFVHSQLLALARAGSAVLLLSTELEEVLVLADRVVALVRGSIVAVPRGSDAAAIGALRLGRNAA
jgi:simple sugar transport system ATP-binding protein